MVLERLTESDWVAISWLIGHLWVLVVIALGTAACYALAHGIIPSLVYTGDIAPEAARRMRMPLYGVMTVGLILMAVVVGSATVLALDLLPNLYPRLAI